jgi:hypothetical protein
MYKSKIPILKKKQNENENNIYNNFYSILDNINNYNLYKYNYITGNLNENNNIYKIPSFQFMLSLDTQYINMWINAEISTTNYKLYLIHNACIQNLDTQYIIWLINKGFKISSYDTAIIAKNGNFELLKYYHKLNIDFNLYTAFETIKYDRLDILKWLSGINKIKNINKNKNGNMHIKSNYKLNQKLNYKITNKYNFNIDGTIFLMDIALIHNHIRILSYCKYNLGLNFNLLPGWKSIYDKYKYSISNNKINNSTLKWLWYNEYKWTIKDAELCNNNFMKSMF